MIDITMTACLRPKVVEQTLSSFKKHMLHDAEARLIINIDRVGEKCLPLDVLRVAEELFPNIISCSPKSPSFPAAFKWTWEQVTADWVLNLEDDWALLEDVDLEKMMTILTKKEDLALLRIPWFRATENCMKNWNKFFPWNGEYFECPSGIRKSVGFAGHPSLIKRKFAQKIAPHLKVNSNPEKQFHGNSCIVDEVLKWQYGVYGWPNSPRMLQDIGALWKRENGWRKGGNKAFFTAWEKVELTDKHKTDGESLFKNEIEMDRSGREDGR